LGVNSKGYGDRTHPFKKAYSYGQKELAIPILSLNPTIKLNEEKPHKQRIMQKFDKPVKEYHKISEEFPVFQSGELFCINKCIQFKQIIKTSINYFRLFSV